MYCLCVAWFGGDECIVCVLQGLVVMSADLEEVVMSVVFVLQGLVVMSADLEEVVMSVLFVCHRVW